MSDEEPSYQTPLLDVPAKAPPRTRVGRWFLSGQSLEELPMRLAAQPWYKVLWLTGVDYFSTLAYQPGVALLAAGSLAPVASISLVAMTLFGALPIYLHVASRSYAGQGSIALLETLVEGWRGKLMVLALLGFACTGFLLTITLSAADAALHASANPLFASALAGRETLLVLIFFGGLVAAFLPGFRRAVGWAQIVAIPYVVLNAILLGRCAHEMVRHPELVDAWSFALEPKADITGLLLATAIVFPKLALGLSGFETGLAVMPQVMGDSRDIIGGQPNGRIASARKMMVAAALIMSVSLLASSFAAAVLVSPIDWQRGGSAAGRTLAHLAHELLGTTFGTIYDLVTIGILWLAGVSAMVGILNLIPRYMPRFGMAPRWIAYRRPLVFVIIGACLIITGIFGISVEEQANVYTTGVLALIHASGVAVAITLWNSLESETDRGKRTWIIFRFIYMCGVCAALTYALVDTIVEDANGVFVALSIAAAILLAGAVSRAWRSTELRVSEIKFADDRSSALWREMVGKKVHVAPLRTSSRVARRAKADEIREHYWAEGPMAFLHVDLVDNRSDFLSPLEIAVRKEDENYVVNVSGAVAIANTIAYLSELLDPISIFLGLTQQNLTSQSIKYIVWGEGETGLMVYMILLRYWRWTPGEEDIRPNIFLMAA